MQKPLRIAVLHGGPSSEHDISVWTSTGVVQTLRRAGHDVHAVFIDREGLWHLGAADAGHTIAEPLPIFLAMGRLQALAPDVCFLGFHGTYGEDGRIQAVLELAGLRYTGSDVVASAAAMDKPLARRIFQGVGIPVAGALEVPATDVRTPSGAAQVASRLVALLGLPVVVKVPAGGSSVGVEIPRDEASLCEALQRMSDGVARLLCEQYIAGIELTAGVLEGEDGLAQSLPLVEIAPKSAAFFDYKAKYSTGATDEIVPARIDADATERIQAIGLAAHHALGCRGVSRTDVILRSDGQPFVLETNTLPGLTPESLLPKAAAAAGMDYAALLDRIVAAALRVPAQKA
jgi:D-alanine-D-alanine ligase